MRQEKKIVVDEFNKIIEDERVSRDELESLKALQKDLCVTIELEGSAKTQFDLYTKLWLIENEPLTPIIPSIHIPKTEKCFLETPIDLYEVRTVTKRISYSGPSTRIRIAKGFSYRIGSVKPVAEKEDQLVLIDTGTLFVMTKKLQFTGSKGNKVYRYPDIINVEAFSDAVRIDKTTGKSPYFFTKKINPIILSAIITKLYSLM